ncbi:MULTISPECIES: type I restriction enzyme endonuclease domain-containing protein [Hydrotalea]|uniref:type I restriction enzyme endonuclease domain-containing protein n=1 Tax=Hydrotalea TaxID=1004300 RepID=UPI00257D8241|nr:MULTISPECIES: type I restriction enzyme endonuclease domain-containing protein [Hydrotalea]
MKVADKGAEEMGLSEDEMAFYNALEVNDTAVQVLGNDQLRIIVREIAEKVKANVTIDWTTRESVKAKLKVVVRRTLKKCGYPSDKEQKAIDMVIQQAEVLANTYTSSL